MILGLDRVPPSSLDLVNSCAAGVGNWTVLSESAQDQDINPRLPFLLAFLGSSGITSWNPQSQRENREQKRRFSICRIAINSRTLMGVAFARVGDRFLLAETRTPKNSEEEGGGSNACKEETSRGAKED